MEQIGVITDLTELDQNVLVVCNRVALLNLGLLQQGPVDLFLKLGDTHTYVDFNLGLQLFLYFTLDTSEQEGS